MASPSAGRTAALRGLSIACFVLYAIAQVGAAVTGWVEFVDEQRQHGSPAPLFGSDGYVWTFLEQTLQNWQSEFLALGTIVVLTSLLIHIGSKHSRDGNDEVQRRVQSIQRRVSALAAAQEG
jgi:hypothetical protein